MKHTPAETPHMSGGAALMAVNRHQAKARKVFAQAASFHKFGNLAAADAKWAEGLQLLDDAVLIVRSMSPIWHKLEDGLQSQIDLANRLRSHRSKSIQSISSGSLTSSGRNRFTRVWRMT